MQCWILVRGMKRQMSVTSDTERNHNCHLTWPQLHRWPLIHREQDLPRLVMMQVPHFPCTMGPTGISLYSHEDLQLTDVLKPQQMLKRFAA